MDHAEQNSRSKTRDVTSLFSTSNSPRLYAHASIDCCDLDDPRCPNEDGRPAFVPLSMPMGSPLYVCGAHYAPGPHENVLISSDSSLTCPGRGHEHAVYI